MIPRTCEYCSRSFFAKDSWEVKRGWARFCSIQCANKAKFGTSEDRFWKNVEKTEDCWLWKASADKDGYGKFYADGKYIRAHIFAYRLHFADYEPGLFVCHRCDNPGCVRPDHLFMGTATDNNRDSVQKGRASSGSIQHPELMARGAAHGRTHLTDADVIEIRKLFADGWSQSALGVKFGISQTAVSSMILRKTWKHLDSNS